MSRGTKPHAWFRINTAMKRYAQFCPVARTLDLVGDRWTLLIVRELLLGSARFADLLDGLPGIARNLLAARLRELQAHGLVTHETNLYGLTARGEQLRPVIRELGSFGAPELASGARGDNVRGRWIRTALDARYGEDPDIRILSTTEAEVVVSVHGQELRGTPEQVMLRIAGRS